MPRPYCSRPGWLCYTPPDLPTNAAAECRSPPPVAGSTEKTVPEIPHRRAFECGTSDIALSLPECEGVFCHFDEYRLHGIGIRSRNSRVDTITQCPSLTAHLVVNTRTGSATAGRRAWSTQQRPVAGPQLQRFEVEIIAGQQVLGIERIGLMRTVK